MGTVRKIKVWLIGIAAGISITFASFYLLFAVGALTGVIAMCATAPPWWLFSYLFLLIFGVPFTGIYGGYRVAIWAFRPTKQRGRSGATAIVAERK